MFAKYYKRRGNRVRRGSVRNDGRQDCTYASLLYASIRDGVTVHGSAAYGSARGCREMENHEPQSIKNSLLRYISRWQNREADIFVSSHMLTGIPIFAEPDSLRIVSGGCSRLVALEQVSCIRPAGGDET